MINIFEAFLPHLLRYPNPSDPLNGEAAALMLRDPKGYESKVRGTWRRFQILNSLICPFPECLVSKVTYTQARVCPTIREQRCGRGGGRRERGRRRYELGGELWGRRRRRACGPDGRCVGNDPQGGAAFPLIICFPALKVMHRHFWILQDGVRFLCFLVCLGAERTSSNQLALLCFSVGGEWMRWEWVNQEWARRELVR